MFVHNLCLRDFLTHDNVVEWNNITITLNCRNGCIYYQYIYTRNILLLLFLHFKQTTAQVSNRKRKTKAGLRISNLNNRMSHILNVLVYYFSATHIY